MPPQRPTVRKIQLGRELRRLREAAGLSRDEVAEAIGRHRSGVLRQETGKQAPGLPEIEKLLSLYGVEKDGEEWTRIRDIAREARKPSGNRVPDWVRAYVGLEAEALEIKTFRIDLVPGLLQTEEYTRVVTHSADPTRDLAEVERLVKVRGERQARLTGPEPPMLWVVLDEAAIRRTVGGPDVMSGQLSRLLELGQLPSVSIHVLPFGAGSHAAMGTAFHVLRVPEPAGAQVVYLEDLWSGEYIDGEEQVRAYVHVFDMVAAAALDRSSTAKMIEEAMGELR